MSFYGGEPLLCFDLVVRVVEHTELSRRPDLRVTYAITTNGTLLGTKQIAFLARHRVETRISFDGVPEAQALRGEGTHAVLDRLLRDLRRGQPRFFRNQVSVTMTVLPSTLKHLSSSVRYFLGREVREILLSPAFTSAEPWEAERISLLDAELERVYEESLRHYETTGRVPVALFRKRFALRPTGPRCGAMCGVAKGTNLAVDVDGQLYGCVVFAGSFQGDNQNRLLRSAARALGIGPVTEELDRPLQRLRAAVEKEEIFCYKENKYSSYGRCADCPCFFTCHLCPAAIAHASGPEDPRRVPDFICAFNRVVAKYRDRFPAQGFFGGAGSNLAQSKAMRQGRSRD